MPTGFWRGVGPNNNVFAIECFMDELARKARMDPIAFSLAVTNCVKGRFGSEQSKITAMDVAELRRQTAR